MPTPTFCAFRCRPCLTGVTWTEPGSFRDGMTTIPSTTCCTRPRPKLLGISSSRATRRCLGGWATSAGSCAQRSDASHEMPGSYPTIDSDRCSSMRVLGALASAALLAGCGGNGDSGARPTAVPTVTRSASSAPASPSASPTGGQAVQCGLFAHPIDPLPTPQPGETQVAEGSGCGLGRLPSNGMFTVDTRPNWILRFAYTCDGTFNRMGDPAVVFTTHNTTNGADSSPVVQPGPWGYGAGGLTGDISGGSPPPGTYIVLVTLANPELHKCQWRAAVGRT